MKIDAEKVSESNTQLLTYPTRADGPALALATVVNLAKAL